MKERISRKLDKKVYQPRIHVQRIKDLHTVKDFTKKPMTVLVDEALSFYLASFFTSEPYKEYLEAEDKALEEQDGAIDEPPDLDDYENIGNYFDNV